MEGRQRIASGGDLKAVQPHTAGHSHRATDGVEPRVADKMHLSTGDALRPQVPHRFGVRCEKQFRNMVHKDPVQLLRHRTIEGAAPRLHMGDGDVQLRGDKGSSESGVRVPEHDHEIRAKAHDDRLKPLQHPRRLGALRP